MTHKIKECPLDKKPAQMGRAEIGFKCERCKMVWREGANPYVLETLECFGPTDLLPK